MLRLQSRAQNWTQNLSTLKRRNDEKIEKVKREEECKQEDEDEDSDYDGFVATEVIIKEEPGEVQLYEGPDYSEPIEVDPLEMSHNMELDISTLAEAVVNEKLKVPAIVKEEDVNYKYLCYQCSYEGTCDEDIKNHIIGDHSNLLSLEDLPDDGYKVRLTTTTSPSISLSNSGAVIRPIQRVQAITKRPVVVLGAKLATNQKKSKMRLDSLTKSIRNSSSPTATQNTSDPISPLWYECSFCSFKTRNMSTLCSHKRAKHDKIRYPCAECNYMASSKCHIERHIKSIHQKVPHPCGECRYVAFDASNLRRHVRNYHDLLRCEHCTFSVVTNKRMREHLFHAHRDKFHKCPLCKAKGLQDWLKTHLKRSHGIH